MDPEVSAFFKRIGYSIGIALLWLIITVVAGLKDDNAFIEGRVTLGNILFYLWMVVSMIFLVLLFKKLWRP